MPRGWRRRRPRSTWPRSSSGWTPAPTTTTSSRTSTRSASATSSSPRSRPGWPPIRSSRPARHPPRSPCREYKLEAAERGQGARCPRPRCSPPQVRRNIQRSTNYVLGVVLFAVSLFFAGMSTKLEGRGSRTALLVIGIAGVPRHGGVDRHVPDQPRDPLVAERPTSARSAGRRRGGCVPPLSIGFSTMATASLPYSSGRPMRFGNAASLVSTSANSSGMPCGEAGAEQARRDGDARGCRGCRGRGPSSASCRRCRPWPRCRRPGRSGPRTRRSTRC